MMKGLFLSHTDTPGKTLFLQKIFLTVVFLACACCTLVAAQTITGLENIHISGDARIVVVEHEKAHIIDQEALASIQKSEFRTEKRPIAAAKKVISRKPVKTEKEKKTVEKPICQTKIEPAASDSFVAANTNRTRVAAGVPTFVLAAATSEVLQCSFGLRSYSQLSLYSYLFYHSRDFHQKLFARPPPSSC